MFNKFLFNRIRVVTCYEIKFYLSKKKNIHQMDSKFNKMFKRLHPFFAMKIILINF
jgi:hypothetical protein